MCGGGGGEVEQFGRLMTRHEKQWLSCPPVPPFPPLLKYDGDADTVHDCNLVRRGAGNGRHSG